MNPQPPFPPHDDLEARITALLLGELPEAEAVALRAEIASAPALQKLHDELSRTIGLVREARNESPEVLGPSAEPLTLSAERREKLLASFKTVQLPTPAKKVRRILPWREAGAVAAMLAVLAGVTVLLVRTSVLPEDRLAESMDFLYAGISKEKRSHSVALSLSKDEARFFTDLATARTETEEVSAASAGDRLEDRLKQEAVRQTLARKLEPAQTGVSVLTNVNFAFGSGAQEPLQNAAAAGPQDANGRMFYSRSEISGVPASSANAQAGETLSRRYRLGGEQAGKNMADHDGDSRQTPSRTSSANAKNSLPEAGLFDGVARNGLAASKIGNVDGATPGAESLIDDELKGMDLSKKLRYGKILPALVPSTPGESSGGLGGGGGGFGGGGFGLNESRGTLAATDGLAAVSKAKPASPSAAAYDFVSPGLPKAQGQTHAGRAVADSETALGLSRLQDLSRDGSTPNPPPPAPAQPLAWFEGKVVQTESASGTPVPLTDQPQTWELQAGARGFHDDFYSMSAAGAEPEARFKRNAIDQKSAEFASAGQKAENKFADLESPALFFKTETKARADAAGIPIQNPESGSALDVRANRGHTVELGDRLELASERFAYAAPKDSGATMQRGIVLPEATETKLAEVVVAGKPAAARPAVEELEQLAKQRVEGGRRQLAESQPAEMDAEAKKKVATKGFEDRLKSTLSVAAATAAKPAAINSVSAEKAVRQKEVDAPAPRKPAPNAAVPQPEVATAENAFSTFSLNVSDVSFKLAAASLEKGVMPDAASVRTEEFINAFDYRDPEPPPGVPIAFVTERARYPFAHDRDLVRFSVKTAAAGRQPGKPYNLVLAIDNSGSMERADRVRILQECLRVLSRQLQPQDKISVVSFARTARLWMDGLAGNAFGELPQMIGTLTPEGGTNLEEAMNLAYKTALRHFVAGGVNRVVLITDGAANLGDVEPDSLKQKVEAFRKQGVALDCFGIGWDGLNDDLLEVLSRNGDGRYGFINTPEAAASDFAGQLAGSLKVAASDVKVQVEWNPRRVVNYRQIGYAKHQLTKEQFRDNTVDAAEIAAAEGGNALYTVQVNPAGEGPLGTVRVRFRVPNTSDYREHEWIVPYAGLAPALDQASSTLRLAATASAFSEWLVASPFAAEVTPAKLLNYLQGVPRLTPADPRPSQLETMIRQAKTISGQ